MKSKFFFNPFILTAGIESFLIGFSGLLLTSYLAYKTGTHFNGFLNIGPLKSIDFAKDSSFCVFLIENISQWIILSMLFLIAGLILSKSRLRVIDIFGTTAFSRIPLIIVPLIRIFQPFQSFAFLSAIMYLIISIYLISLTWSVILLFNAFKVSCNLKNEKLIVSFIVCIILSEVFTKIFLHILI